MKTKLEITIETPDDFEMRVEDIQDYEYTEEEMIQEGLKYAKEWHEDLVTTIKSLHTNKLQDCDLVNHVYSLDNHWDDDGNLPSHEITMKTIKD